MIISNAFKFSKWYQSVSFRVLWKEVPGSWDIKAKSRFFPSSYFYSLLSIITTCSSWLNLSARNRPFLSIRRVNDAVNCLFSWERATTVVTVINSDWGFWFCRASSQKESRWHLQDNRTNMIKSPPHREPVERLPQQRGRGGERLPGVVSGRSPGLHSSALCVRWHHHLLHTVSGHLLPLCHRWGQLHQLCRRVTPFCSVMKNALSTGRR